MPSKVSLMNSALRVFAGSRIVSPDDGTAESMHCSLAWDGARDTVLAVYPWGFATRWARLALHAGAPAFGFRRSYALPADCLYLVDVREEEDLTAPPAPYCLVGGAVYADAAPALARYVYRHENCELWPPHFCEVFSLRLALEVAPYLVQDAGIGIRLRDVYHQALRLAAATDAGQGKGPQVREVCEYIDGRWG